MFLLVCVSCRRRTMLHWRALLARLSKEHLPVTSFLQELAGANKLFPDAKVVTKSNNETLLPREMIESVVLQKALEASGINMSAKENLMESGLDSLAATELRLMLQQELKVQFFFKINFI